MLPVAIAASVRIEQGATSIPSVGNEPEAMDAPTSATGWTTAALAFTASGERSSS